MATLAPTQLGRPAVTSDLLAEKLGSPEVVAAKVTGTCMTQNSPPTITD